MSEWLPGFPPAASSTTFFHRPMSRAPIAPLPSAPAAEAAAVPARRPLAAARDLAALAKPRLSLLVLCTAAGGLWLAPGQRDVLGAAVLLAGTALVVGAANALNNFLERDVDARMRRTRDRPLPAGRVEPWVAVALGLGVPSLVLPALAWFTNGLTATLAALALFVYVVVYTPMKQHSSLALFVGAVPGAIPPLMGWTAATGRLEAGGLALFALLFCWQLPHFLAISLYLKEDYARGGLRVFALVHGERATQAWCAVTSLALVPVSLMLLPLGVAGPVYGVAATILGAGLAAYALAGWWQGGTAKRWARNFFLLTLAYLTLLFAALLAGAR
jgi:protoheme IX farnesyltransferase